MLDYCVGFQAPTLSPKTLWTDTGRRRSASCGKSCLLFTCVPSSHNFQFEHQRFFNSFFNLCCTLSTDTFLVRYPPQVEVILDTNQLIEEIGFLKRTLKTKRSLASLRAGLGPPCGSSEGRKPYEHSSTKIRLLMDWVRTVSDFYNLKVSVEFSGCC